jgi:MFS family permease
MAGVSYRWVTLGLVSVSLAAYTALAQGLGAVGPVLRSDLHLTLAQTVTVLSAMTFGTVLTLVAWGALGDRYGERIVIVIGLGGACACLAGAAFASTFVPVLALLGGAGMCGAATIVAGGKLISGWFGARELGTAVGVRQMAAVLGGGAAAVILPLVAVGFGLRGALFGLAGLSGLSAVLCLLGLRSAPTHLTRPTSSSAILWADPRMWWLSVGGALLIGGQMTLVVYVVLFLNTYRHWSVASAALVLAAIQFGGAAARLVVGHWSDRRQNRLGLMRWTAASGALTLVAVALLADASGSFLLPVLVAAGIVSMSSSGLGFAAMSEIVSHSRLGTAMAVQNTVIALAGSGVPIAFGVIVTILGWPAGFIVLGLLAVGSWTILGPLERLERRGWMENERVPA